MGLWQKAQRQRGQEGSTAKKGVAEAQRQRASNTRAHPRQDVAESGGQRQRGQEARASWQDVRVTKRSQGGQEASASGRAWQKRSGSEARKPGLRGKLWQKCCSSEAGMPGPGLLAVECGSTRSPVAARSRSQGCVAGCGEREQQKCIQEARACQDEAEAPRQRGQAAFAAHQDGADPQPPQGGQQAWVRARMRQKRSGSEAIGSEGCGAGCGRSAAATISQGVMVCSSTSGDGIYKCVACLAWDSSRVVFQALRLQRTALLLGT